MATNNSDTSFLDNAKEYASNAYNQTKDEFSRVSQNSKDRNWIVERESKLNNLTLSQKEQLKYISSADDAMKFVEAATAGDRQGAEKLYSQALKGQGGAIASFAGDVATTALGGAAGKAAFKAAPKLFKGAAEVIGENIPSLKKVSNVFKSAADKADEALSTERAARAAAREQRAQESIQRAQAEQQQARTATNSTATETPFRSNTTRATETVQETITPPPEQSIFGKVADWTKNKIVQGADWAGGKVVEGAKSVGSGIASLGKTTLKGAGLGAAIGIPAGEYYENLSDEEKTKWQEKAQKGVDWVDNAIDHPGEAWEDIKKGAGNLLGDVAGGALGAAVGKGSNPFRGISAGMGSLFTGGGSVGSTFNSMPSGGDSGRIGESHFGGGDVQGKSAIEVLNKIYNVLAKTNDTINSISRDVSSLTRSQSQQNATNDLNSANMQARQNEMGSATPIYGGGGGGLGGEEGGMGEADKGFWSKLLGKINPKAAGAAAVSALNPAKKVGLLSKIGRGILGGAKAAGSAAKAVAPTAARVGGAVVGAELLNGGDDKAAYAKNFFMNKGYTEEQAAGIVGNLQGESGNFNKDVISGERRGDGGKAVGIAQWHPDRQAKFKEIMHKDLVGASLEDQLEFVDWELNNSHKSAGNDLRKQTTAEGAAKSVERKYEITAASMHGGHSSERVRNAEKLMGKSLPDKKETSSAKPVIKGVELTGDRTRNPYFIAPGEEEKSSPYDVPAEDEVTTKTASSSTVTEHATRYAPKKDMSNASPDEIREEELAQQAEELAKNPGNLTVDEINAKNSEISRERNNIEFNRINKENPSPYVETVENVTTANEHHVSPKETIETSQYTTTTNKHREVTTGGGVTTRTAEEYQPTELDKAAEAHEKDPVNNPDPLAKYHTTPIPGKPGYYMRHGKEVGPGDILEGRKDTASPVKNTDTEEQVAEIDRQKATLENERNEIGQSGVNVDKETMDKQLDRLSDIHTEMSSLNEQRNNLTGNQNGQTSPKPAAPPQQQAQQTPPPPAPAGTGKSVPGVRNDDPTIKMMEEGSMWSTQGGLMA
jgi:hypothetical protein